MLFQNGKIVVPKLHQHKNVPKIQFFYNRKLFTGEKNEKLKTKFDKIIEMIFAGRIFENKMALESCFRNKLLYANRGVFDVRLLQTKF